MALPDVLLRCTNKWSAEGIALAPPIPESEVRRVWDAHQQELSADVSSFYTLVGGFQEYVFEDGFFWSLWPWDWMQKRNAETRRKGVMFCDHSIEIVTWELRYESPEHSSVWSSHDRQAAPTLESFFQRYLDDPWQLL